MGQVASKVREYWQSTSSTTVKQNIPKQYESPSCRGDVTGEFSGIHVSRFPDISLPSAWSSADLVPQNSLVSPRQPLKRQRPPSPDPEATLPDSITRIFKRLKKSSDSKLGAAQDGTSHSPKPVELRTITPDAEIYIADQPSELTPDELPSVHAIDENGVAPMHDVEMDLNYLGFPFLQHNQSLEFIGNSKVIFIMRGLQGSGKSTVANAIADAYVDSRICSADNFWWQNGEYLFVPENLALAHNSCKEDAVEAVLNQMHVIVIDNTNIKYWEFKFYLQLAKEFHYIPLVIEPWTPWKYEPAVLAQKNIHSLSEDVIAMKLEQFNDLQPLYFGWFLNEVDSAAVSDYFLHMFEEVLNNPELSREFTFTSGMSSKKGMLHYFSTEHLASKGRMLHCTAKFTGKGKAPGAYDYMEMPEVEACLGKVFSLSISSFIISPRTVGARIALPEDALQLWGQNDAEDLPNHFLEQFNKFSVSFYDHSSSRNGISLEYGELDCQHLGSMNGIGNECIAHPENDRNDHSKESENTAHTLESSTVNGHAHKTNKIVNGVQLKDTSEAGKKGTAPVEKRDKSISPQKMRSHSHHGANPPVENTRTEVRVPENMFCLNDSNVKCTLRKEPLTRDAAMMPLPGYASRAHLTLMCAEGVSPVTTGFDVLVTNNLEQKHLSGLSSEGSACAAKEYRIRNGAIVRNYGHGMWCIYLPEKLVVEAIYGHALL